MKTTSRILALVISIITLVLNLNAQPNSFSYQSSVRNNDGTVLANQNVAFKFEILNGTSEINSTVLYAERQVGKTDDNGMYSCNIGQGGALQGTFPTINWTLTGKYYLRVSLDDAGGSSYTLMGTTQLVSVPFALNAANANTVTSVDWNKVNFKPTFSTVATSGDYNDLTNKPAVDTPKYKIGQQYQGGTIFFIDATGNHGLIVANTNAATNVQLSTQDTLSLKYNCIDGLVNTNILKNNSNPGAGIAAIKAFNAGSYTDWYLPSQIEFQMLLNTIYQINSVVNMFNTPALYATSSYNVGYKKITVYNADGLYGQQLTSNAFTYRLIRKF